MSKNRKTEASEADNSGSRRADGGSGAPRNMGQGGPQGNPSGPRDENDPGSTRYGQTGGSGANEPKRAEKKEQGDWTSRQGGDQST